MQRNESFYKEALDTAPVTTPPQFESGALSAAQAKAASCTRRMIELRVPSTASSGCSDCYPNAEISVGAGSFANSKDSRSTATCRKRRCRKPTARRASIRSRCTANPAARRSSRSHR